MYMQFKYTRTRSYCVIVCNARTVFLAINVYRQADATIITNMGTETCQLVSRCLCTFKYTYNMRALYYIRTQSC